MTNARRNEAGRVAARMGSGGSSPSGVQGRSPAYKRITGIKHQHGVYVDVEGCDVTIWQVGVTRALDPIVILGKANLESLIEALQKAREMMP